MNLLRARLLLVLVGFSYAWTSCAAQSLCSDEGTSPWIKNMYEHVTSFDSLGVFAMERYGPVSSCEAGVATVYDGMEFGRLRLSLSRGAVFQIETMPPEASVATLIDSAGLGDEATLRDVLARYTRDIGLSVDWDDPTSTSDGGVRAETYWDPDDGLNASAQLVFRDSLLISVRVSLAL